MDKKTKRMNQRSQKKLQAQKLHSSSQQVIVNESQVKITQASGKKNRKSRLSSAHRRSDTGESQRFSHASSQKGLKRDKQNSNQQSHVVKSVQKKDRVFSAENIKQSFKEPEQSVKSHSKANLTAQEMILQQLKRGETAHSSLSGIKFETTLKAFMPKEESLKDFYEPVYKFPIIKTTKEDFTQFSKCQKDLSQSFKNLYEISPFKFDPNSQQRSGKKMRPGDESFHSEDVLETIDENEPTNQSQLLDQIQVQVRPQNQQETLEQITMEDNNKAQKTSRQSSSFVKKQQSNQQDTQDSQQRVKEVKKQNFMKEEEESKEEQLEKIRISALERNKNEKVFELQPEQTLGSIKETSFDSLNQEGLFMTNSEIGTSIQHQSIRNSQILSQANQNFQARPSTHSKNSSFVEQELQKIDKNLQNFTLDHFNNLRAQIQEHGFQKAATKAKRQFGVVDSITTIQSLKEDEYVEDEMTRTEEDRLQKQLQVEYKSSNLASKNLLELYQKSQSTMVQNSSSSNLALDPSCPLLQKLVICSLKAQNIFKLLTSIPTTGFQQTPALEFSAENPNQHAKAFIDKQNSVLLQLITEEIVYFLSSQKVRWLSCGFEHCVMVLEGTGELLSWGYGASGCLGTGSLQSQTFPQLLNSKEIKDVRFTFVEAGGYHNAAISESGELYTWGRSDVGQLGHPISQLQKDQSGYLLCKPKKVDYFTQKNPLFKGRRVVQVSLGEAHTLVLDNLGQVYSFGWGQLGQLGVPSGDSKFQIQLLRTFSSLPVKQISCGAVLSTALTERGQVYIWGSKQNGQLGLGPLEDNIIEPRLLSSMGKKNKTISIICGESHVLCLTENKEVYGWGTCTLVKNQKEFEICELNAPKRIFDVEIVHKFLIQEENSSHMSSVQQTLKPQNKGKKVDSSAKTCKPIHQLKPAPSNFISQHAKKNSLILDQQLIGQKETLRAEDEIVTQREEKLPLKPTPKTLSKVAAQGNRNKNKEATMKLKSISVLLQEAMMPTSPSQGRLPQTASHKRVQSPQNYMTSKAELPGTQKQNGLQMYKSSASVKKITTAGGKKQVSNFGNKKMSVQVLASEKELQKRQIQTSMLSLKNIELEQNTRQKTTKEAMKKINKDKIISKLEEFTSNFPIHAGETRTTKNQKAPCQTALSSAKHSLIEIQEKEPKRPIQGLKVLQGQKQTHHVRNHTQTALSQVSLKKNIQILTSQQGKTTQTTLADTITRSKKQQQQHQQQQQTDMHHNSPPQQVQFPETIVTQGNNQNSRHTILSQTSQSSLGYNLPTQMRINSPTQSSEQAFSASQKLFNKQQAKEVKGYGKPTIKDFNTQKAEKRQPPKTIASKGATKQKMHKKTSSLAQLGLKEITVGLDGVHRKGSK